MKFHKDKQRQKKIEFWRSHLESWRGSGLTQELYCREYGLQFSTFARYRNQINSEARLKRATSPQAISTELNGTHQSVDGVLGEEECVSKVD